MMDASRLELLEIRFAHQERVIDDLNATVTAQWKEIERLKADIVRLSDRLSGAELMGRHEADQEPPPPHW